MSETAETCGPCAINNAAAEDIRFAAAAEAEQIDVSHDPEVCRGGGCNCTHGAPDAPEAPDMGPSIEALAKAVANYNAAAAAVTPDDALDSVCAEMERYGASRQNLTPHQAAHAMSLGGWRAEVYERTFQRLEAMVRAKVAEELRAEAAEGTFNAPEYGSHENVLEAADWIARGEQP